MSGPMIPETTTRVLAHPAAVDPVCCLCGMNADTASCREFRFKLHTGKGTVRKILVVCKPCNRGLPDGHRDASRVVLSRMKAPAGAA